MADDNKFYGAYGAGKWDIGTSRYIPVGGGSRSRLEVNSEGIRPYRGFAGIDRQGEKRFDAIGELYSKLGGGARISAQDKAFLAVTIDPKEQ